MRCRIVVYTGDKPDTGTDAAVKIRLYDVNKKRTPTFTLDALFRNDYEQGEVDDFQVDIPENLRLGKLERIEVWRDENGVNTSWYVDKVTVEWGPSVFDFPIFRWIKPHHRYLVEHLDTSLPQFDKHHHQRQMELQDKQKLYTLQVKVPGLPAQVSILPDDEKFSNEYRYDLDKIKQKLAIDYLIIRVKSEKWTDLESLKNVFSRHHLPEPESANTWTEDSHFGNQRVTGVNPILIRLCTEIPDKFGVTDKMVAPFLEGMNMQSAIQANRLFIIDLYQLEGLCSPLALFFENKDKQLMPVAIQLFQRKGPKNPVFLPSDDPITWLLAKMWYNNADSAYHQALTHLGFTHLIMEGISVITHRNLSQSHPIFKLLAPHFLYLIAINTSTLKTLICEGGWLDNALSIGVKGALELIRKGVSQWRLDVDGTLPEELKQRGCLDQSVLGCYPYRDDALLLYQAIQNYVRNIVELYYDTPDKLEKDFEIQTWAKELVTPRESGGCGILGVPGNGCFKTTDQLVLVLTSIITTCSVAHAAFNFPQYENYAFTANYPLMMFGKPPTDKKKREESDIINSLPEKPTTLNTILIAKILSKKGTNSLGHFETNFVFDPKAVDIVEQFKSDLAEISQKIKENNKVRRIKYEWLDPEIVPNSIGI